MPVNEEKFANENPREQDLTQELLEKMYAAIHNVASPSIGDVSPYRLFTLYPQGLGIDPEEFDDTTEAGQKNRNNLLTKIPMSDKIFTDSTRLVDSAYTELLTSTFPPDKEPSPEDRKKFENAKKYVEEHEDEYGKYRDLHNDAVDKLWELKNTKGASPTKIAQLQRKADEALKKWTVHTKGEYEKNYFTIINFTRMSPNDQIAKAYGDFQALQASSPLGVPVDYTPTKWHVKDNPNIVWTEGNS